MQEGRHFGTEAGDWFYAMIIHKLNQQGFNYRSVREKELTRVINFTSKIVGTKVLHPKASDVPEPEELLF